MSNNNKLEALRLRLHEIKDNQSLINLLDSMGFFAMFDFLNQVDQIKQTTIDAENSAVGGLILLIEGLVEKSRPYKNLKTKTRAAFNVI